MIADLVGSARPPSLTQTARPACLRAAARRRRHDVHVRRRIRTPDIACRAPMSSPSFRVIAIACRWTVRPNRLPYFGKSWDECCAEEGRCCAALRRPKAESVVLTASVISQTAQCLGQRACASEAGDASKAVRARGPRLLPASGDMSGRLSGPSWRASSPQRAAPPQPGG
jgi:hypothetical protein